jgi:hypothetical protein
MQAAGGTPPTQSASRMWRSSNGNMRLDSPHTSIITIPASQKTIMLDHLKKEAMVIPMPPVSSVPSTRKTRRSLAQRRNIRLCKCTIWARP